MFGVGCGIAGLPLAKGTSVESQPAGARIGVFATANYFADATAGQGPQFSTSRTLVFAFWRSNGTTNNQCLWGFNTATSGWCILAGNSRNLNLFFRNSGFSSICNVYFGLHVVALTRTSGGTLRASVNGGVAYTVTSPGSYISAAAGAIHAVGKNQGEASQPATQASMLWQAVIDAEASDAELQAWSDQANALDRWHAPPAVRFHSSLLWFCNWEDWDGSSSTFAGVGNGGGASPYTLTKNGTGGGKTPLTGYLRYAIPPFAIWDSSDSILQGQTGLTTGTCRNFGATTQFISSAADTTDGPAGLVIDEVVSAWNATGNICTGINVDDTNLAANNNGLNPIPGLVQVTGYGMRRAVDCPGIVSGAGKTFKVIEAIQSKGAQPFSGGAPTHIRVPATAPLIWIPKTPPTDTCAIVHDSRGMQMTGVTEATGVKGPPYQAWTMLARANMAGSGRRLQCYGWGFGTWAERIKIPADRTAFVDQMVRMGIGTTSNYYVWDLGTNDYPGSSGWASLAGEFEPALTAAITDFISRGISGWKLWVKTPNKRTDVTETNNNTAATPWNLPGLRTSMANVVTAIGNANVILMNAVAFTSDANRPDDGLHDNTAGHVEHEGNFRTAAGFY
jgi:hypothetical protein